MLSRSLVLFVASPLALFVQLQAAEAATVNTGDGPVRVRNWGYQLQGPPPNAELTTEPFAVAAHDLVVLDFARFGDEGSRFTPQQINAIKNSAGGDGHRKVATSYISIGEASEFRSHWDASWTANGKADSPLSATAPSWLGPVNPDFTESRKVRYWDAGWQDEIFNDAKTGWLDQIVTQGFDGAYLDIIDAYYFWGNEADASDQLPGDPANGQDAARRMAQFVVSMTEHARATNPDFFVIPQNGEFLLNDLRFGPAPLPGDKDLCDDYLDAISAIAIEDTYYCGDEDENNALDIDADKVQVLKDDFLTAGKPVLVVDYVNDIEKMNDFLARARADGFTPYAAPTRDLDSLAAPAPSLAGDFNNNGTVDAADYAVWRAAFGSAADLDADAVEDGVVNTADYTVWRDVADAAATALPEPTAWCLAAVGLLAGNARRRDR